VTAPATDPALLAADPAKEPLTVARNVSTRYLAIAVEMVVGLALLPFNVGHLGKAAYGLWILTTSITMYFSVLDLGYSGALVKFVAQYRARRDMRALNEILSTTFYIFATVGVVTYLVACVMAIYLDRIFNLTPDQASLGRIVLLVTSVNVALGTAFSVFGAVINGFQRYDLNNLVGAGSSVAIAVVNVLVLLAGFGLAELVVATTTVRVLTYAVYRRNAYRVFPGLRLRAASFSRARLKEVTGLSVYMLIIDWANKLNYSVDALVIGAFLNTSAVAVWSIGQRLAEATQRLTNQLNDVLFPTIVDNDTASRLDRLQAIFLVGTRLSLAAVIAIGGVLILMARPLVTAWVGTDFVGSIIIVRLLAFTVIMRTGNATAATLLKAAGSHRLVAFTNGITALVNLSLSIALVGPLGLTGVAIGTLVPVCASAMFVLFPAGCRRVQLSLWRVLAVAIWPAVWPAAVMAAYVAITTPLVGGSLAAVGVHMMTAAALYGITFLFFGISAAERRFYVANAVQLTTRWRAPFAAVTEGA
jgi:O-antigen/teichoic acid export membrane protein